MPAHLGPALAVVPVLSLWWANDVTESGQPPARALGKSSAFLLLTTYTDPGQIVLDGTGDMSLEQVSAATGRDYARWAPPGHQRRENQGSGDADLVLLPWPRPVHKTVGVGEGDGEIRTGGAGVEGGEFVRVLLAARARLTPPGHLLLVLAAPFVTRSEWATAVALALRRARLSAEHLILVAAAPAQEPQPVPTGSDRGPTDEAVVHVVAVLRAMEDTASTSRSTGVQTRAAVGQLPLATDTDRG